MWKIFAELLIELYLIYKHLHESSSRENENENKDVVSAYKNDDIHCKEILFFDDVNENGIIFGTVGYLLLIYVS